MPEEEEKINLKNLYEIFRCKKSHGLVSIQFLGVLSLFFGTGTRESKNAITKLYTNRSYAPLSGADNFNFDAFSDLISSLSFSINKITLTNRDRREVEDAKNAKEIIDTTTFVPLPNPFQHEIIDDQFENLEHKKIRYSYVEPQVKDAQTIEMETKTIDNEFSKIKQEFDKVNNAVTEQKLQDDAISFIDNILEEDNPFKNIDNEEFWIEDGLFDNNDGQDIKDILKEIIDINEPFVDIIEDDFKSSIETITIDNDFDIPSDDRIAIDAPKKIEIITDPNRLHLASNRIKKKYFHRKSKGLLKKSNKKAVNYLRKAGYLDTDDLETVDYNNHNNIADLDDVATADYNNDNNLKDLDDPDLKKIPGKQIAAKKIVKKHRNLARKKPYQRISKKTDDDNVFLKQVPVHLRDRLAKKTKDEIKFVKQVPLHLQERFKRKSKLGNYSNLNKKIINDDVTFIKQVPLHPTERLKRLEKINGKVHFVKEVANAKPKILVKTKTNTDKMKNINRKTKAANENTRNLMIGEFNFDPKEILNKTRRLKQLYLTGQWYMRR